MIDDSISYDSKGVQVTNTVLRLPEGAVFPIRNIGSAVVARGELSVGSIVFGVVCSLVMAVMLVEGTKEGRSLNEWGVLWVSCLGLIAGWLFQRALKRPYYLELAVGGVKQRCLAGRNKTELDDIAKAVNDVIVSSESER